MTYIGESTTCTWISQTMEIGDMWKVLEKAIGESMSGRNIWYSLKFDRSLLMPFAKEDIVKLIRDNDGHACLYIARKEGPCNLVGRQGREVVGGNACAT